MLVSELTMLPAYFLEQAGQEAEDTAEDTERTAEWISIFTGLCGSKVYFVLGCVGSFFIHYLILY